MSRVFLASAIMSSLIGCGSDSDSASGSGVDGSTKLTDLSSDDAAALCDYQADLQGGYEVTKTCDGSTFRSHSRADCITLTETIVASCTATVADNEACLEAVGEDLCKLFTEPKCAFLAECGST